jgi:hypothetical protein
MELEVARPIQQGCPGLIIEPRRGRRGSAWAAIADELPAPGKWGVRVYQTAPRGGFWKPFSSIPRFSIFVCIMRLVSNPSYCPSGAEHQIANSCKRWRCSFKGLSQEGDGRIFLNLGVLSLMKTFRVNLISDGSISLV